MQRAAITTGSPDMNLNNGVAFTLTPSGTTTLTFSNVPSGTFMVQVTLQITNGGLQTINYPAGTTFVGGAPALQSAGVDLIVFRSFDAGTTWNAVRVGIVGTAGITDLAVTSAKLAADSVITAKILDANVTAAKLAAGAALANLGVIDRVKANRSSFTITAVEAAIPFTDADSYDTGTWHDTGTNPSRITIPGSLTGLLQVTAQVGFPSGVEGREVQLRIRKNGSTELAREMHDVREVFTTTGSAMHVVAYDNNPSASDYYEVLALCEGGDIAGSTAWFAAHLVR